jgi:hypothetical protein
MSAANAYFKRPCLLVHERYLFSRRAQAGNTGNCSVRVADNLGKMNQQIASAEFDLPDIR